LFYARKNQYHDLLVRLSVRHVAPLLFENYSRNTRAPFNLVRCVRSPISFLASFTRLIVYLFLVLSTMVLLRFYLRTILTFLDGS